MSIESREAALGCAVVLGTGSMAPEIATALDGAGWSTVLVGRDAERARAAGRQAAEWGARGVRARPLEAASFAEADLVVETIVEDLQIKRSVLGRIESWCDEGTVIATNTSSLRIADIATGLARPARFAGLHFLKPGHLTGVVEVIPGPATAPATVGALSELAAAMGKTPLVVRADEPGFIWNRIQFAVLRECLHMVEAGIASPEDIDAAVADGLAPRWTAAGPLATADLGGLATFGRICAQLFPHLADGHDVPAELARRAEQGVPLAPWTQRDPEALAALRAEALAQGRALTRRRTELSQ